MRRFYLQNQNGVRLDLNGANGLWFTDPYGLGIESEDDFAASSLGFFLCTSEGEQQARPGGVLKINDDEPYRRYRELMTWMLQASALYLIYTPDGFSSFLRRVKVDAVTKTEKTMHRWLEVPICFAALTPWYQPTTATLNLIPTGDNVLAWDVGAWDVSTWGAEELPGASVRISPRGQIPASFRLEVRGAIVSPTISLIGESSGITYGRCAINASFDSGEGFTLDTTEDAAGVWKIHADGSVTSLLNALDLAYDPFPRIPISEKCILKIESEVGAAEISSSVVVYQYYRTV